MAAILDEIRFEQLSSNREALSGVRFGPPIPTTTIGITAQVGFQAKMRRFLVGLEIEAKARMTEEQIGRALGDTSKFSILSFSSNGEDPADQNSATVDIRVFTQADYLAPLVPGKFLRLMIGLVMCAYPGETVHLDFRECQSLSRVLRDPSTPIRYNACRSHS